MTSQRLGVLAAAVLLACFAAFWASGGGGESALLSEAQAQAAQKRPNILFIFMDDANTDVLKAMDNVNERIKARGATFENATFAKALCCPNRAAMLRGQFPHNTNVLDNHPPNGGYQTFASTGLERDTYATTINGSSYDTFYAGKYFNGYSAKHMNRKPPGWDFWYGSSPSGKCFSDNGVKSCPSRFRSTLHDRWLANQAVPWIRAAGGRERPFLATLSFHNPHTPSEYPATYAGRYSSAVNDSPSYDEADVSDKPKWIQNRSRFNPQEDAELTRRYRDRLRAADFSDDQIGRVLDALHRSGESDDTYVVFWSDNGYHVGEHRLVDKTSPYVEASRLPLFVKGPGIGASATEKAVINAVDIRATLEDMAVPQANSPAYEDGHSFLPIAQGDAGGWPPYTYSESPQPTDGGSGGQSRPAYRAVYTATTAYNYYPETGEEEFYDLTEDPFQLDGTVSTSEESLIEDHRRALVRFTGCEGQTCRQAGNP